MVRRVINFLIGFKMILKQKEKIWMVKEEMRKR